MPIWAIFELLSFGQFGHFVSCIEIDTRHDISKEIGIKQSDDTDGRITQQIIYAIRDLRNAIAHNDVVFDVRFRKREISKQLKNNVTNATNIKSISFDTIVDYFVLIIYVLKLLGVNKKDLKKMVNDFKNQINILHKNIPTSLYNQIIYTDVANKLNNLINYISI